MPEQELKQLLTKLHQTLETTETVDAETLQMVRELEDDLDRLAARHPEDRDYDSLRERAQLLDARFAARHPTAERFLREIIDLLAKVGI